MTHYLPLMAHGNLPMGAHSTSSQVNGELIVHHLSTHRFQRVTTSSQSIMDLLVSRQVVQPAMVMEASVLLTPTVVVDSVDQVLLTPAVEVDLVDQVDQADQVDPIVEMRDRTTAEAIILVDRGVEVVKAAIATVPLPL